MWRILPLLLLAACSDGTAGTCQLQKVADLPVVIKNGGMLVTGKLNGVDTQLTIDTGAGSSAVSAKTVKALGLHRIEEAETRHTRRGGVVTSEDFAVNRIAGVAGEVEVFDVPVQLQLGGASSRRRMTVFPLDGINALIGTDVLRNYDVELDLPAHRIRLWNAPGCGSADIPWTGQRIEMPIQVTDSGSIRLDVAIDSKPFVGVLDSGAGITMMTPETARSLGVDPAALADDPSVRVRGIAGDVFAVHMHRFDTLRVGGERITKPMLGVSEAPLAMPGNLLLGIAFLNGQRTWIAYRTGRLFIQPVTPAAASPPA